MDQLKAMETFVQVAKAGSLSKAARDLGISRPLVSAHLKHLELHLGVRLINRSTRQFSISNVGLEYLRFCKSLFQQIHDEESAIFDMHNSPSGSLKIVVTMSYGNSVLAPIVSHFARLHTSLNISLIVADSFATPVDLSEHTYDLAIMMNQFSRADIICSKIDEVQWLPCVSPKYIARFGRPDQPGDLVKHNCLYHRSGAGSTWTFKDQDRTFQVTVRGNTHTNSVMVLRAAALDGLGIAMLPRYCIESDLKSGALVPAFPHLTGVKRPVFAIIPTSPAPKKVRLLLDFFRKQKRRMYNETADKAFS